MRVQTLYLLYILLVLIHFYRLAVKTGSIALQKFIYLFYFIFFFFLFCFAEKSLFFGVKFSSPDSSQKTNGTL